MAVPALRVESGGEIIVRKRALFSLVGALIAAIALVSASGAATTRAQEVTRIDVSTRSAIVEYLRSIHVNPTGVVIQRGAHNYAGANCPGARWSCTTTNQPVVQVASAGGTNTFNCTTGSCAVIQVANAPATVNTAKCIKTSGLGQSCIISQSSASGDNAAGVFEREFKNSGLTQAASAAASITQQAASGSNTACVHQEIDLEGSTNASGKKAKPINVALEAHQSIAITQDAPNGTNSASQDAGSDGSCVGGRLTQTQTLSSTAGGSGSSSVTQNENATDGGANMTLDIRQNEGSAFGSASSLRNDATFTQTNELTAVAFTPSGPVNQTQSSSNGGILATVNQDSNGVSTADANQQETQCEDAVSDTSPPTSCEDDQDPPGYSLTQSQFGPVRKGAGDSTQTGGNPGDTFTVTQSSTQDNDLGGSSQSNVVQGDCHTSGNCTVTQTTDINGTKNTNTQSGQDVNTQTNCTGSECMSTGPSLTFNPNGLSVSNTDVSEFGEGGMRGNGTGSINVSGITGPVGAAVLYWNGPTNSTDPNSNASVTFNGAPITGTNIGTANNNCWGFTNSQSYRADVTPLVTGDGTYSLSNFTKANADINGVSLIVFYDDGNASDDRNVALWNGNDSNVAFGDDASGWDETISGVEYSGSGSASLDTVVSDGQTADDPQLLLNGNELAPAGPIFQGASVDPPVEGGNLWDVKSFDIASLLESGPNDLNITTGTVTEGTQDCISLVVAAANVPASSGPVIG